MDPEIQAEELTGAVLALCTGYRRGVVLAALAVVGGVTIGSGTRDPGAMQRAVHALVAGTRRTALATMDELRGADGAG